MKIELFLNKTVEQNAALYYERAKRAKEKREGVLKAIQHTKDKIARLNKEKDVALQGKEEKPKRQKEWYEKFHWFYSSEGFLCIGGRDATSNEIVVKKHAEKKDLIFHTDMAGSPFFVVKNGQEAGQPTLTEVAQATASYSKAWKLGLTTLNVFFVKPEQVTKKAKPGEFMAKGAFMVYGESTYLHPQIELAVGVLENGMAIGGPLDAVKKNSAKCVAIIPGRDKTSDIAKKIKKKLGGDLDEITSFIPAGGSEIKK